MALSSHLEVERKYDADDDTAVPDLSSLPGIARVRFAETVAMRAVYYDTEDLALAGRRVALRRREGGADEGWHLKLPGDLGRHELQADLTPDDRVPGELRDTVEVILRGRPLAPLARVETSRTAVELLDAEGSVRLELADDRVTGTALRTGRSRTWREWEAELVGDGSDEAGAALLDAVEALLLAAGARSSESSSKLAHALGADRLGEGPGGVSAADASAAGINDAPDPRVVAAARRAGQQDAAEGSEVFLGLRRAFEAWDPRVRRDEEDSTHQLRTTARRLRCLLEAGSGTSAGRSSGARDELRRLGAVLGVARDIEVQRELIRSLAAEQGVDDLRELGALEAELNAEYSLARTRVVEYLNSTAYFELLDALDDERTAQEPTAADLELSLRAAVERVRRRTAEAGVNGRASGGDSADSDNETGRGTRDARSPGERPRLADLHRLRRGVRRVRYLAEAAAGATEPASATPGAATDTPEPAADTPKPASDTPEAALAGTNAASTRGHASTEDLRQLAAAARGVQDALGAHRDLILVADRARLASETAARDDGDPAAYDAICARAGEGAEAELAGLPDALELLWRAAGRATH